MFISTIEDYYTEISKIFNKHKVRRHERMFLCSVGMMSAFIIPDAYKNISLDMIQASIPDNLKSELSHRMPLIQQYKNLWEDLIPFLKKCPMNLGDYVSRLEADFQDGSYYETPKDIVNLIYKLVDRRAGQGKIYDMTAGTGSMLLPAVERGFDIYGQEQDAERAFACFANIAWKNADTIMRMPTIEKNYELLKMLVS